MAREDVQTMQKAYDAFNRADIPGVMEAMHSEIRWTEPGGGRAPAGTFTGPESVANDVFAPVPENFEEFSADAEEWIDAASYLAVVGHFRGSAKSGAALDVPSCTCGRCATARPRASRTWSTAISGRGPGAADH